MSFSLPTFNLNANIWHTNGANPNSYLLPDLTVPCNLSVGRRVATVHQSTMNGGVMILLLPSLTDIRAQWPGSTGDIVEVPAGSSRFYYVIEVDDFGKGFANEHRFAYLNSGFAIGATFALQGNINFGPTLP